jgi:bifunctional non-homologous end joining protein LigD
LVEERPALDDRACCHCSGGGRDRHRRSGARRGGGAHCGDGLPDLHRLLGDGKATACLYAFDLLFINGEDLRPLPLDTPKETLASALQGAPEALRLSEHMDGPDGPAMFAHACRMGLEGIGSKRRARAYRSGRCPHWLKILSPGYVRR